MIIKRILQYVTYVMCLSHSFDLLGNHNTNYGCDHIGQGPENFKLILTELGIHHELSTDSTIYYLDSLILNSTNKSEVDEFHIKYAKAYKLYIAQNSKELIVLCKELIYSKTQYTCNHLVPVFEFYNAGLRGKNRYSKMLKALNYIQNTEKTFSQSFLYRTLANIYFHLEQYTIAISNFKYLLEFEKFNLADLAGIHNNIGLCYINISNKTEAKIHFNKALEYWNNESVLLSVEKQNYDKFKEVIKSNIQGLDTDLLDNIESIYKVLKKEYDDYVERKQVNYYLTNKNLLTLAEYAYELKKYEEGDMFLKHVKYNIDTQRKLISVEDKPRYEFMLLQQSIIKGNIDNAILQSYSYQEEQYKLDQNTKALYLETTPVDNEWKTKLLTEREKALKAEKQFKLLLYLLVCILIVFLVLIYQGYFSQKQSKNQIAIQKQQLQKALNNTEMLLKEVHHRVKNNLQLVTSIAYIEYEKNDEHFDFQGFENRIISLSLIHRLLYSSDNISDVSFNVYMEDLMLNLQNTAFETFNYDLNIESRQLPLETAITFGLLINELVTNTIKHCIPSQSEQKHIYISFNKQNDIWVLNYTDNGTVFKRLEDNHFSLGDSLIELLIHKLRGKYTVQSSKGYNLHVSLKALQIV